MLVFATDSSSRPSTFLSSSSYLVDSPMNSYRTVDDFESSFKSYTTRSPSFDSSSTLTRRYGIGGTSTPITNSYISRQYPPSSSTYYDSTSKYSSSSYEPTSHLVRSKPPIPTSTLSSLKYSSAANSPNLRVSRFDTRSSSGDRSSNGGGGVYGVDADSYRSAVMYTSGVRGAMDDYGGGGVRRIPVNSVARKFDSLAMSSDHHYNTSRYNRYESPSPSVPARREHLDYSPSTTTRLTGYYERESSSGGDDSSSTSLYKSKVGAYSVPDVPTYAKIQVRHELEDDDEEEEERDYLERRSAAARRKPVSGSSGGSSRSEPLRRGSFSSIDSVDSNRKVNDTTAIQRSYKSSSSTEEKCGLLGLRNLGNTCFMNSVIQCLSHTRLLRDYFVQMNNASTEINNSSRLKGALAKAFCELLCDLWTPAAKYSSSYVNPEKFKMQIQKFAPRFTGYNQQDAQEFLRYLLQGLHEDVNRVQNTKSQLPPLPPIDDNLEDQKKAAESWKRYLRIDDSKIVDVFVGQLKSELKCTHCGHVSTTFDPFWDLSLPIPSQERRGGSSSVSLYDCMDFFAKEEILEGDEKPTCDSCKVRRRCTKKFLIQKFPQILVLHLKRFSGERYRSRLSTLVDFPTSRFDLTPYAASGGTNSAPKYDLYAVSNHSGTPTMGHYTAYCKHATNGGWFLFDDTRVSSVSENSVVSGEAYVLFYELSSNNVNGNNRSCTTRL